MDSAYIRTLYDYNRWANARVLGAAATLTEEEFTRDLHSSYGSVRDTLTHILGGEWVWLERWQGRSPRALPAPADFPTVVSLTIRWDQLEGAQRKFVDGVTDSALDGRIAYVNTKGERWEYPLWQMMVHLVNHSTYHRGQVATMLRQLGAQPVATDFLVFYDLGGAAAVADSPHWADR